MSKFQLVDTLASKENAGLYVRVHTEIRSYSSHMVKEGSGTMAGLYLEDHPTISQQKDFFLSIDPESITTKEKRARLYAKIRSVRNETKSLAVAKLIDEFFNHSRAVKQQALSDKGGKAAILTQDEVRALQEEINTKAIDIKVVYLSLLRREEEQFRGSHTSQADPLHHAEKRVVKFYCLPNEEVTADTVIEAITVKKDKNYASEYVIREDRDLSIEDRKRGRKGNRVIITPNNTDLMKEITAQAKAEANLDRKDLVVDYSVNKLLSKVTTSRNSVDDEVADDSDSTKDTPSSGGSVLDAVIAEASAAEDNS